MCRLSSLQSRVVPSGISANQHDLDQGIPVVTRFAQQTSRNLYRSRFLVNSAETSAFCYRDTCGRAAIPGPSCKLVRALFCLDGFNTSRVSARPRFSAVTLHRGIGPCRQTSGGCCKANSLPLPNQAACALSFPMNTPPAGFGSFIRAFTREYGAG